MIVLDNAGTRALSLINTQNGANVEVCFSDYTTSSGAYARGVPTLTTISSATTTSICATPSSGVIRDVDYVNIYNTYAGSQTFTVQITSGSGGPFVLVNATLLQNESLNYTHGSGWCALDANGNRKEATSSTFATLTVTGNATVGGTLGVTGTLTAGNFQSVTTAFNPTDDSGAGLSLTVAAKYEVIGKLVFITFRITYPATASGASALIGGLPFTINNNDRDNGPLLINADTAAAVSGFLQQNTTQFYIVTAGTFTPVTNATLSGKTLRGSGFYFVG